MAVSEGQVSSGSRLSGGLAGAGVCAAALLAFVFQNTEDVRFNFLVFHFTWPLWLYTVVVAAVGAFIWITAGVVRRHRRRMEWRTR